MSADQSYFQYFKKDISPIPWPERFTFPFYYEPHELSHIAVAELQDYLNDQEEWQHNFGLDGNLEGATGKMFGVLVVAKADKTLGYIAAVSGKLADSNENGFFVPPIYDMLKPDGYFKTEEQHIHDLTLEIVALEKAADYQAALQFLQKEKTSEAEAIATEKLANKKAKKARKAQRAEAKEVLSDTDYKALEERLKNESLFKTFALRDSMRAWQKRIEAAQAAVDAFTTVINNLKEERKARSGRLQEWLFDQYHFLDKNGNQKALVDIFKNTPVGKPPSGAGECAAPKLLQYAYEQGWQPIAMAEFWWGKSPKSEVRKHKQFYPSCRGKCEPILGHMLQGLQVDENPMLKNPAIGKTLEIVYEDTHLLLVNKPAEFLSVPGKTIHDSVQARMKKLYPDFPDLLLVHRLDMSTSGLILIAKTKDAHKRLQAQFIKRTVEKRYIALLEGCVDGTSGLIDLPLRVDLDNRPQQLVCYEHGKPAQTRWEVIKRNGDRTVVHFFPITGRTHQLRVHAAHPLGLNCAIVGDDLYGTRADRLHLHAEYLVFEHPVTRERMTFHCPASFRY